MWTVPGNGRYFINGVLPFSLLGEECYYIKLMTNPLGLVIILFTSDSDEIMIPYNSNSQAAKTKGNYRHMKYDE